MLPILDRITQSWPRWIFVVILIVTLFLYWGIPLVKLMSAVQKGERAEQEQPPPMVTDIKIVPGYEKVGRGTWAA